MRYQLISAKTSGSRWSQHFAQIDQIVQMETRLQFADRSQCFSYVLLKQPSLASSTLPFGNAIFTFASLVMDSRWFKNYSKGSSSQTEMCCAPQIYPCYTNTMTFLSCAFIFYCSGCGIDFRLPYRWYCLGATTRSLVKSTPSLRPWGHPPDYIKVLHILQWPTFHHFVGVLRKAADFVNICQLLVSVVLWQTQPMDPECSVWR